MTISERGECPGDCSFSRSTEVKRTGATCTRFGADLSATRSPSARATDADVCIRCVARRGRLHVRPDANAADKGVGRRLGLQHTVAVALVDDEEPGMLGTTDGIGDDRRLDIVDDDLAPRRDIRFKLARSRYGTSPSWPPSTYTKSHWNAGLVAAKRSIVTRESPGATTAVRNFLPHGSFSTSSTASE